MEEIFFKEEDILLTAAKQFYHARHLGYESLEGKLAFAYPLSSQERGYLPLLVDCLKSEWDHDAVERANIFISTHVMDWDGFIQLARKHLFPPLLWRIAHEKICFPDVVMDRLKQFYFAALKTNIPKQWFERHVLEELLGLKDFGIDFILLKGSSLGQLIYADPAVRYASDIDVIVHAENFPKITNYLQSIGYRLMEETDEINARGLPKVSSHLQFRKSTAGMVNRLKSFPDILVELHVSLVGFHYRYAQDWQWLWENSWMIEVHGLPIRALNHEARFLNLSAHLVVNHDFEDLRHTYELAKFCHLFDDDLKWIKIFRLARKYEFAISIRRVIDYLHEVWSIKRPANYRFLCWMFPPRNREKLFFDQPGIITALNRILSRISIQLQQRMNVWRDFLGGQSFSFANDQGLHHIKVADTLNQSLENTSTWLNEILHQSHSR